jgi:hypothetical protein
MKTSFEPGDLVTLDYVREKTKEEAPLFIVLGEVGDSARCYDVYCFYSDSTNPRIRHWMGSIFEMPERRLIKFNHS